MLAERTEASPADSETGEATSKTSASCGPRRDQPMRQPRIKMRGVAGRQIVGFSRQRQRQRCRTGHKSILRRRDGNARCRGATSDTVTAIGCKLKNRPALDSGTYFSPLMVFSTASARAHNHARLGGQRRFKKRRQRNVEDPGKRQHGGNGSLAVRPIRAATKRPWKARCGRPVPPTSSRAAAAIPAAARQRNESWD